MSTNKGEGAFFRAWATFVVNNRFLVLGAFLAVTIAAVFEIKSKLQVDMSVEAFAASHSGGEDVLECFRDVFGRDDLFMVMIEGDVFSEQYLDKLGKLHAELAVLNVTDLPSLGQRKRDRDRARGRPVSDDPCAGVMTAREAAPKPAKREKAKPTGDDFDDVDFGDDDAAFSDEDEEAAPEDSEWGEEGGGSIVDEITSLINARQTKTGPEGGLIVGELMEDFKNTPEARAALKETVLGNKEKSVRPDNTLIGRVVGPAGDLSVLLVRTQFMSDEDSIKVSGHVEEIVAKYHGDGFKVHLAGMPSVSAALQTLMLGDMKVLFGAGMLLLTLVLIFLFRHPIGAGGPVMVVVFSILWSLGAMAAVGINMTMLSNILPAFFICVGVADSVHLISVYRQLRVGGMDGRTATIEATASTGKPVFFTSLTTALGLLSFELASVHAISEMGRVGAFGVGVAFLQTVTILPAILSFNKTSLLGYKAVKGGDWLDRFVGFCAGLSAGSARRRYLTLGVCLAISTVAVGGALNLKVYHNPISWVPQGEPIRDAIDLADEKLSGTTAVQLLIQTHGPLGMKDVELLKGIEKLDAHVKAYVDKKTGDSVIGNTISVIDVVRETNRALKGGTDDKYRIPDTQMAASDLFMAFENSSPEQLKRLMTIDGKTGQMTISTKWLEATSYAPLTDHVEVGVKEFIPADKATVKPTGAVYTLLTTVGALIWDLIRSFSFALVLITIIMVILLRSVKLGLIAMAPNLLPIAYILGVMGIFGIPIDMANLMIASIALGIAVDDTIHFLHHWRVHYAAHGSVEGAIQHSLDHSGRALVATSLLLSAGFFVYLAATMYSLQRFGSLIGLTVIFAVLVDLIMAPALLRTFFKDKDVAQSVATPQTTLGGNNEKQPALV